MTPDPDPQFKAYLRPTDDGYIFYPKRRSPGVAVSEDEYVQIVALHRRAADWTMVAAVILLTGLAAILAYGSPHLGWSPSLEDGAILFFVAALAISASQGFLWRRFARTLVGQRATMPPRRKEDYFRVAWTPPTWLDIVLNSMLLVLFTVDVGFPPKTALEWALVALCAAILLIGVPIQVWRKLRWNHRR
jgi:hypothetical protein